MAAGYFGGYSAKMQDIGLNELKKMQAALDRSQSKNKAHDTRQKEFNSNSRRLLKDLESKGIVRTAVETTNLALHADNKDKSRAECFRTFPTIMFPVAELLSREEIENGKKHGFAVIKTIHTKNKKQSFIDAPIDLLYGFRGKSHNVTLLSPYEMIRYWQATEIQIPTKTPGYSEWTEEGLKHKEKHKEECKDKKKTKPASTVHTWHTLYGCRKTRPYPYARLRTFEQLKTQMVLGKKKTPARTALDKC